MNMFQYEKQQLRNQIKAGLSALNDSACAQLSLVASHNVCNHAAYQNAKTILCYIAMQKETDPVDVARRAYEEGKRVAFPYCVGPHSMIALQPETPDCLEIGAYGILAPMPARSKEIPPDEIDLIIVPGLAFDIHGGRIGRGAGFYDRYLQRTNALRMGFCFHTQIVERIPMEQHDCVMHALVTDIALYDIACDTMRPK